MDQKEVTARRDHKDRLFCRLFGDERHKENLLSLYNALSHTDYKDPERIEINTVDNIIYMGMHNDVSCIIDCSMTLFEQQSTLNYNMPLRGFMYFSQLFDKYLVQNGLNIYQRAQIKIPAPQFYVLYNGTENCEDRVVLRLSDAFQQEVEPGTFEWTAIMVNINDGHNQTLMDQCRPLREYSVFVGRVRDYTPEMGLDAAVDRAVSECISEGILADFLATHKAEVIDVVLTEYNEKAVMDAIAKENRTEGIAEGLAKGRMEGIAENQIRVFMNMISRNFSMEDAMAVSELTEEQAMEALDQMGKKQPV